MLLRKKLKARKFLKKEMGRGFGAINQRIIAI